MEKEIFFVDSNSLIAPFRTYYSFDLALKFWEKLGAQIRSGDVVILDLVADEILNGKDELKDWLLSLDTDFIDRRNDQIITVYREILDFIKNDPCYKPEALQEWSNYKVADAWLIAASSVYGGTIVTFEASNHGLNKANPSKNPKIPDVAAQFGVNTIDLFHLMRVLQIDLS